MKQIEERKLNKEQAEAVAWGDGPLLIVAGAGTGKTTVITERIANLIKAGKAKPEEILALTFTEKAAEEMADRVEQIFPDNYSEFWISTFHSFCERALKNYGLDILDIFWLQAIFSVSIVILEIPTGYIGDKLG